jgi:predicted amidohydrolase
MPELWLTGYFNFERYESDAMSLDEARERLGAVAKRAATAVLFGSIAERDGSGRLTNSALLFDSLGELRLRYEKTHLFPYLSQEPDLMSPGDDFPVVELDGLTVGVMICYDLRFPEVARTLVKAGADLLAVPAAWPASRVDHWRLLLQARAVESQVFVVGCNAPATNARGADSPALGGNSMAVGPLGDVLATAEGGEGEIAVSLNLADLAMVRARFDTSGRGARSLQPVAVR